MIFQQLQYLHIPMQVALCEPSFLKKNGVVDNGRYNKRLPIGQPLVNRIFKTYYLLIDGGN